MYASKITDDITNGKYPSNYNVKPAEVSECRMFFQQIINTEKKIMKKDKQSNEAEQIKNRKNNSEGKNQLSNQKLKQARPSAERRVAWNYSWPFGPAISVIDIWLALRASHKCCGHMAGPLGQPKSSHL